MPNLANRKPPKHELITTTRSVTELSATSHWCPAHVRLYQFASRQVGPLLPGDTAGFIFNCQFRERCNSSRSPYNVIVLWMNYTFLWSTSLVGHDQISFVQLAVDHYVTRMTAFIAVSSGSDVGERYRVRTTPHPWSSIRDWWLGVRNELSLATLSCTDCRR